MVSDEKVSRRLAYAERIEGYARWRGKKMLREAKGYMRWRRETLKNMVYAPKNERWVQS